MRELEGRRFVGILMEARRRKRKVGLFRLICEQG